MYPPVHQPLCKNFDFSLFSAFLNTPDLHEQGMWIKKIVQWKVFFHLKFMILEEFEDISWTYPMSCPVLSKFTGKGIEQSQSIFVN